jgi:uncharacterized protein YyaL (SSP411 family)
MPNQLINEKSPYLLQHADNPVDWYPWSEEAFDKAKNENKPIFLSIGYSTCHWCHVMAHESFEDPDVAKLMNEAFVNIKVDREERPDIDKVYMEVCQMMTGSGGWPLTIIMTPEKEPFFAATYIPKDNRFGRLGLLGLVPEIVKLWSSEKQRIVETIDRVKSALTSITKTQTPSTLDSDTITLAITQLSQRFDEKAGGFGRAPKFPSPHNLLLLLRHWNRTKDEWSLFMVEKTLKEMRKGGIFDHLGFGFHRYSTDAHWLLPHFEKMLYDQAMLLMAYTEAYQITRNPLYAQVADEIFTYIKRDLMSPEGGFYSAEDADSEGEEGKFYIWSMDEIKETLNPDEADVFFTVYNIRSNGNFQDEATGKFTGMNILHIIQDHDSIAKKLNISLDALTELLESSRQKLFKKREERIRPLRDEKVLTDWNGLMIAALAKAARVMDKEKYIVIAKKAADFIFDRIVTKENKLLHVYKDEESKIPAFLDDYAFLIWGLIELFESTFQPDYLSKAKELTLIMLDQFWDEKDKGFFFTGNESEELLVRQKQAYDGAIPSGNSVAILNLVLLARLLGQAELEQRAIETLEAFSNDIVHSYIGYGMMLIGLDFLQGPSYEVVIAGNPDNDDTKKMLQTLKSHYLPNIVLILKAVGDQSNSITELAPFTRYYDIVNGKATAHVCINQNCKLPTNDIQKLLELLGENY